MATDCASFLDKLMLHARFIAIKVKYIMLILLFYFEQIGLCDEKLQKFRF